MSKPLLMHNSVFTHRTERGMTQEDLASAVSVTRHTIIAIEKGNYVPSLALAYALARELRIDVTKLFWE